MTNDGFILKNVAAGTYQFSLTGGRYQLSATATWNSGSLILKQILPNGSSVLQLYGTPNTSTPATQVESLAADGVLYFDLPPGGYELIFATGSALYAAINRIPLQ